MESMVIHNELAGDRALCIGQRLFGWPNFMGAITHILYDAEGEPVYHTEGGDNPRGSDRIYHYMVASSMVHPGQRRHPRNLRLRTLNP